jgi:hypothetical protein
MSSVPSSVQNCCGKVGVGTTLFDYWNEHDCLNSFSQYLNTGADGTLEYNAASQSQLQSQVHSLFSAYLATNSITDDVTSPQYNNFQERLVDLCIDPTLPGVCTQFLTGYCSGFTREQVQNSRILTSLCGCYTPPDANYLQFTLGTAECSQGVTGCVVGCTAGVSGCTGQPACDPLCHRALTSQRANSTTGSLITCPQNVCVISQVAITAQNSTVSGGINFTTVCPGCGGGEGSNGCLCVVGGVDVASTFSDLGIGVNIEQFCGSASICLVEDPNGNIISQSGCAGFNPTNVAPSLYQYLPSWGVMALLGIVTILVLLLILTARFAHQKVDRPLIVEQIAPNQPETRSREFSRHGPWGSS